MYWAPWYQRWIAKPWIQPLLNPFDRASRRRSEDLLKMSQPLKWTGRPRVWLHGSSVGELESLWPLVRSSDKYDFIVTGFSDSALSVLDAAVQRNPNSSIVHAGLSPREGQWGSAIERLRPDAMVSVRYEAWPELWQALGERQIPFFLLGAQYRASLKWARRGMDYRNLCKEWPHVFSTVNEEEYVPLRRLFERAELCSLGDPRFDEIHWKASHPPEALLSWLKSIQERPRPWGILGSAWPDETQEVLPEIRGPGTLFVFPHETDATSLHQWNFLDPSHTVLVPTQGWLTAAYSSMDWAWVGGGFGKGVHSVIEPLSLGLPVASGPQGMQRFKDYGYFERDRQLTVCTDLADVRRWRVEFLPKISDNERLQWRLRMEENRGASHRVLEKLDETIGSKNRSPA